MIKAYIGPNGYGKTTKLNETIKMLKNSGISEADILFLESEILLSDEVKDSKDETKTMEYILSELLETPNIITLKSQLQTEINNTIGANQANVNSIIDSILNINGQTRTKNFISPNSKGLKYKQVVTIDNKEFLDKTGSGQRMQLLWSWVKNSNKKYIFLDEPEKYSHPSLLNVTAKLIMDLSKLGKDIYIATHSPKLLSMLNLELQNIYVINDSTHYCKNIDISGTISELKTILPVANFTNKYSNYYETITCSEIIKTIHYKDFLECLFSNRVYLCEGVNDKLFLFKYLQDNGEFFDDYVIMSTFGKYPMPLFLNLFKKLGIHVSCVFDEDDETKNYHKITNDYISSNASSFYKFNTTIESELGYTDDKNDSMKFYDYISGKTFLKTTYKI